MFNVIDINRGDFPVIVVICALTVLIMIFIFIYAIYGLYSGYKSNPEVFKRTMKGFPTLYFAVLLGLVASIIIIFGSDLIRVALM